MRTPLAAPVRRLFVAFLVGAVVVRLGLALTLPVLPEETYYVHWGWHPALGYVDHPPMVAWLDALSVGAFGANRIGARLPTLLLGLAAIGALVALGRRTVGRGAALAGAALFLAIPLAHGYGVVATPDAPVVLFGLVASLFAARALLEEQRGAWLGAGVAFGLAFLSKYTAVFVPAGVALFCVLDRDGRRALARPGPWLAVVAGALVASPVVVWNARHGWISFAFQSTRRAGGLGGPDLFHPLELVGSQAALATPVLFAGLVWALVVGLRRDAPRGERLLACLALPNVALMALVSFFGWVKINWLLPAYAPLALLLAARFLRGEPAWLRDGWRAGARRLALGVGPAVVLLAWLHVAIDLPGVPKLPRTRGWDALATRVESELASLDPARRPFLVGGGKNYQTASALAFALDHRVEVRSSEVLGGHARQYALWFDEAELIGRDAVVVVPVREKHGELDPEDHGLAALALPRAFDRVEPPERVDGGAPGEAFLLYRAHGYRGVPGLE